MASSTNPQPNRGKLLFENLFERRQGNGTFEIISAGLSGVVENATRLVGDARYLLADDRYASAAFVLATADEEMAKSYILLDLCRLDPTKHETVLKGVCRAFYDHVPKHAYNRIARHTGFRSMEHVGEIWETEVTKWWPADDPAEPDMPHDTYFTREMPLYVDFVDYDQDWFVPNSETRREIFETWFGTDALAESGKALERLKGTSEAGLFRAQCLAILNRAYRTQYVSSGTSTETVSQLAERAAELTEREEGISRERYIGSALDEWPLYHFASGQS